MIESVEMKYQERFFSMYKRGLASFALIVVFGAIAVRSQTASVDTLGWMAGCWELSVPQKQMTISEHWMKPSGGTLIGMSRTVRGVKTTGFEFIRIVTTAAGIDYVARPSSNKDETAFKLIRSSATEVVFENLAHDFPQRIIYRDQSPDALFARIEGMQNGKLIGMDIPMKRVKCE
ncbi:MAG: DUF6265 family protein [Pyrinomonadaceae bacterium]